ncbi:MAG: hypothetical protein ACOY5Y_11050 [Pseudomonadota bacterium]|jgi:hypothetical protein
MKAVVILAALGLSACMGSAGFGQAGGLATYDEIKAAQADCAAKGGALKLQRNGDPKYLHDYACEKE